MPIKIHQTIPHNPPKQNGNCFQAVIASVIEMPIEQVFPVQNWFEEKDWHIRLFFWLRQKGWIWREAFEMESFYKNGKLPDFISYNLVKDKYYLVSGKTNRHEGKVNHICIYYNGELWHDPHPDGAGLITQEYFEVIEPLENISRVVNTHCGQIKY